MQWVWLETGPGQGSWGVGGSPDTGAPGIGPAGVVEPAPGVLAAAIVIAAADLMVGLVSGLKLGERWG